LPRQVKNGAKSVKPISITRRGRPPTSESWQVEDRILSAATSLFLKHGFDGTSLEEVALAARAGKTSVYRRFSGKEALFNAVVTRSIEQTLSFEPIMLENSSTEDRLTKAVTELLGRMLTPEVVSVMRLVIAEISRFPDLAKVREVLAQRLIRSMLACALDADVTTIGDEADVLLSLVLLPFQFRALMGADLALLRKQMPSHAAAGVRLFLSANATKTTDLRTENRKPQAK
jgi:AcrR family transcriptional regulator